MNRVNRVITRRQTLGLSGKLIFDLMGYFDCAKRGDFLNCIDIIWLGC